MTKSDGASVLARVLRVAFAGLALSGCALLSRPEDDVAWPWRVAEVISVGSGAAGPQSQLLARDCSGVLQGTGKQPTLAVLLYRDGPGHTRRIRTARVPVVDDLHVGDRVQFDSVDCLVAKIPGSL